MLVECQVQCRLEFPPQFMGFVNVDNIFVPRDQEQGVQISGADDRLTEEFVKTAGHFLSNNLRQGGFANSGRPDKHTGIHPSVVGKGRVNSDADLFDDAPLPHQMGKRGRDNVIHFVGLIRHENLQDFGS